jgi:hypothetical protein
MAVQIGRWPCGPWEKVRKAENQESETKKPGAGPGFLVDAYEQRATAYPAECPMYGRRAREVIPAAIRALVKTTAV